MGTGSAWRWHVCLYLDLCPGTPPNTASEFVVTLGNSQVKTFLSRQAFTTRQLQSRCRSTSFRARVSWHSCCERLQYWNKLKTTAFSTLECIISCSLTNMWLSCYRLHSQNRTNQDISRSQASRDIFRHKTHEDADVFMFLGICKRLRMHGLFRDTKTSEQYMVTFLEKRVCLSVYRDQALTTDKIKKTASSAAMSWRWYCMSGQPRASAAV